MLWESYNKEKKENGAMFKEEMANYPKSWQKAPKAMEQPLE